MVVWFVFLCCCWCSLVLQEQRPRVRLSGSLLVVDEVWTLDFQNTRPQELPVSPFQQYDGCIGWLILILQLLQTFVELARCKRVMTTQTEFHFSWVYTFSATPRSLRIWAPVPPTGAGYNPALSVPGLWSRNRGVGRIFNLRVGVAENFNDSDQTFCSPIVTVCATNVHKRHTWQFKQLDASTRDDHDYSARRQRTNLHTFTQGPFQISSIP